MDTRKTMKEKLIVTQILLTNDLMPQPIQRGTIYNLTPIGGEEE
jgi:hypothetical protein